MISFQQIEIDLTSVLKIDKDRQEPIETICGREGKEGVTFAGACAR